MQKDNKERISGDTVEVQDQQELAAVRSELLKLVRVTKGLPADPVQLDVKAVSQLSGAPIIENVEADVTTKILDISNFPPDRSAVGFSILQKRLKDKQSFSANKEKRAA